MNAVIRVRSSGCQPRTKSAGLVYTLFQNLALLVFLVKHQLLGVLRRIQLAFRRVNADLAEHAFHAEGACFVRHDGHDVRTDVLVANQRCEKPDEDHRGRSFALTRAFELRFENLEWRHLERLRFVTPLRQVAAE